jgi:hypothetical protein
MDSYALRMVGVLAAATIHRWLGGAGIPRRYHYLSLIAGVLVVDGLSVYFSVGLRDSLEPLAQSIAASPFRLSILEYLFLTMAGAAMLMVVFAESSASQSTQLVATARTLPVSRQFLTIARGLPTALALGVLGVGVLPPAVATVVLIGGVDLPRATLALGVAMSIGVAWGLLVIAALRMLPYGAGRGLPASVRYPIAVCAWAVVVGLQVWWLQTSPVPGQTALDWAMVWPLAVKGMDSAAVLPMVGSVLIAAACLVAAGAIYILSPEPEARVLLRTVRLRWTATAPLALLRLEVLRLWRTGRVRSVAAVNLILGVLAAAALLALPELSRGSFGMLAVMSLAVLWMAIPMMSRGVGRWHQPMQLQVGISPLLWGWAVTAAGCLWGVVAAAPSLILLSLVASDFNLLTVGAFLTVFGFGLGSLFGFVFPAGGENTVGEVVGVIICGIALFAGVWIAGQALKSPTDSAALLGIVGAALLPATGLIEMARWRVDIGSSRA